MPEAAAAALAHQLVERLLAGVPERRVTEIVAEADRLAAMQSALRETT